jgi:hypothetical protein
MLRVAGRLTLLTMLAVSVAALGDAPSADAATFTLLTHPDAIDTLPQPNAIPETSGDHLIYTADDITGTTYNPSGCLSFNFMNPVGAEPPGYAEGIHSMTGSLVLDVDLATGGAVGVDALAFDGFVAPKKPIAQQRLVNPGDPAADGNHGPVDGTPNAGSYAASSAGNWALDLTLDWYYDTPFAGSGSIDMTFNDYGWSGFIFPVSELTVEGMAEVTLDDPLGFFGGTSGDFEAWLLAEVAPRLPQDAGWLLFAQGEAHPDWTNPNMGMTTDGIVGTTIIAYAVPEPGTVLVLLVGVAAILRAKRR